MCPCSVACVSNTLPFLFWSHVGNLKISWNALRLFLFKLLLLFVGHIGLYLALLLFYLFYNLSFCISVCLLILAHPLCKPLCCSFPDWIKDNLNKVTMKWNERKHLTLMGLSSPQSRTHSSLPPHLPISFSSNNGLAARAAGTMRGRDQTLYCLRSSHTPGASRKSLSLVAAGCPAVALWPECIWYYSQLNVGFTEDTWIKRVTARTYLVLCNTVNRFAEWGFNVCLYTNIMSTSWNISWAVDGFWSDRCDTWWVRVSLPWWFTDTA